MEEEKNETQNEKNKMTYEELSKAASELHVQYQKLMAEYQKAMTALNSREFDYMSFFLSMLFKVMDHPNMYKTEFVKWCQMNIQNIMTSFAATLDGNAKKPEEKNEETDSKNEAE